MQKLGPRSILPILRVGLIISVIENNKLSSRNFKPPYQGYLAIVFTTTLTTVSFWNVKVNYRII